MKRKIFIVLIQIIILASCEKIDKVVDLTNECEFHDNILTTCFSGISDSKYDEIVISDNETYQAFGHAIRIHPVNVDCDTAQLPFINFNKYSLLGKRTTGGGCSAKYERKIIKDLENEKIIYQISVIYEGDCYMLISSMNWVFIPKLSPDYKVEFELN